MFFGFQGTMDSALFEESCAGGACVSPRENLGQTHETPGLLPPVLSVFRFLQSKTKQSFLVSLGLEFEEGC